MRNIKFKFGWLERRRFSAERKRQIKAGIRRYCGGYDREAETYWQITPEPLDIGGGPNENLTEFSKKLAAWK
jgi:hypothetical protein